MNWLDSTIFGFTAWRIYAGGALLLLYVLLRIYWVRARRGADQQNNNQGRFSRAARNAKDKAVVGLTDTQRIDQLHRVVSLKAGEQADLKELTFGNLPLLRVVFAGVEHAAGRDFAHIKVDLGGAAADCGTAVEELGENDFLVPRGTFGDQNCLIHYTCKKSDAVSFLQVRVSKFDAVAQSAAIDVTHVRGRRAA